MNHQYAYVFLLLLIVAVIYLSLRRDKNTPRWWVCSWCDKWFNEAGLRQEQTPASWDGVLSHGICPHCADEAKRKLQKPNARFITKKEYHA